MDISAKEWLLLLAAVDRLRNTVVAQSVQCSLLLQAIREAGVLPEEQLNRVYQQSMSARAFGARTELARHEFLSPANPQAREILKESGVVKLPPETVTENLDAAFEELMERALAAFREAERHPAD